MLRGNGVDPVGTSTEAQPPIVDDDGPRRRGNESSVPTYEFSCGSCEPFDAVFPMASVPDAVDCAACGSRAPRRMSSPRLGRTGSAAFGLIDRAARSAHEPEVVSRLPGAGRPARAGRPAPRTTGNPLHLKLPRA